VSLPRLLLNLSVFCLTSVAIISCSLANKKKNSELKWTRDIPVIGSQSSPRAADLNGDGILDIVMGAGKNEFQASEHGIVAFDGKTGELLWKQSSIDQVYGAPAFVEVTGDGVMDVFIGGRSPQLKALDGKTGKQLWSFDTARYREHPVLKFARYNFNSCVLVPDQNNDGSKDLLTINGGNSYAAPYSLENRYPAVLMLLDSKKGEVIAADTMPDGRESYMTPVVFTLPGSKDVQVIFGTGGETIDGNLYVASLKQLVDKRLRDAKVVASESKHGFIASPSIADVSGDGIPDIIAITHGSKAVAVDGASHRLLWTRTFSGTECSNNFAVGNFNDDDVPDFFTFISKGQWPNSTGSVQVMINGKNGEVEYTDSIGCTGFSSPVIYDLNNDGRDEAIISVNEYDCSLGYATQSPTAMENKLIAIDFQKHSKNIIDQARGFKNIFTTPWIGDLDSDGYLDLVHCQYYHHSNLLSFLGMRIKRIDLPVRIDEPVKWGEYLGSGGNGVYP
jgi:outer membrane protein assembly factor BamB